MTRPQFDYNDFPIETDQAQIEVTLPVGQHVLELVVEDSAGLRSAPSTVVITVEQAPPVINQIQPNSGQQGETVPAVISGENLLGISQVIFSGNGVSAVILPGGANTSVSIEITIASGAGANARNFTVTTPGGTATSPAGVEFTVTSAVEPVITVSPRSGPIGATVNIEGAGFAPSSPISITFDGVSVSTVTSDNRGFWARQVTVPDATLREHLFTATDADGNSASAPFRVEPSPPVITAINPDQAFRGSTIDAVITGRNLAGAREVTFSGTGIIVNQIRSSTSTSISIEITIASGASIDPRSFTVTTPGGQADSPVGVEFTVLQRPSPPIITGINPTSGIRETESLRVIISGQNLAGVTEVTFSSPFSGPEVAVNQVISSNDTTVTADIMILPTVDTGPRSFTVTTPGGTATSPSGVTFAVFAAPTIGNISPDQGTQGSVVDAILHGANLQSGLMPVIIFSGTGVNGVLQGIINERQINVRISIERTAAAGPRTYALQTTRGGTHVGMSHFTVIPIIDPTIPSVIPTIRPTFSPILGPSFGPIIPSTISLTASPAISAAAIQPVNTVPGIGPTFSSRLEGGGIRTAGDLASAQPAQVARLLGISEVRAMSFIDEARRLRGQ